MSVIEKLKEGVWNVGIITLDVSDILAGVPYSIMWMKHKYKDRFFADPFLYSMDDQYYYLLAEEYKFYDRKGRIVLLTVDKQDIRLIRKELVLEEDYHLSYPIPYNNRIHPECFRSGVLSSYDIRSKGIAKKRMELDYPLIDPTYLIHKGVEWLFGTSSLGNYDAQRDLFVFYKSEDKYIPIKKGPVKSDVKSSRPGGLFFERDGTLYRPAQNCEHFYGESIKIMKVDQLDKDGIIEHECLEIKDPKALGNGIHTFNAYDGFVVVDGFSERTVWSKILYIKFKWLYNIFWGENDKGYLIKSEI